MDNKSDEYFHIMQATINDNGKAYNEKTEEYDSKLEKKTLNLTISQK